MAPRGGRTGWWRYTQEIVFSNKTGGHDWRVVFRLFFVFVVIARALGASAWAGGSGYRTQETLFRAKQGFSRGRGLRSRYVGEISRFCG